MSTKIIAAAFSLLLTASCQLSVTEDYRDLDYFEKAMIYKVHYSAGDNKTTYTAAIKDFLYSEPLTSSQTINYSFLMNGSSLLWNSNKCIYEMSSAGVPEEPSVFKFQYQARDKYTAIINKIPDAVELTNIPYFINKYYPLTISWQGVTDTLPDESDNTNLTLKMQFQNVRWNYNTQSYSSNITYYNKPLYSTNTQATIDFDALPSYYTKYSQLEIYLLKEIHLPLQDKHAGGGRLVTTYESKHYIIQLY